MIRTENLSMVFATEDVQTRALNQINLEIGQGEFVAIMGPSGCGKSTLLNILGTLDTPTSGKYFINEIEMTRMSESQLSNFRKKNIGFVFQSFNLIDELTVFENVELPLVYLNVRKSERRQKVTWPIVPDISRNNCPEGNNNGWPLPVQSLRIVL